MIHFEQIMMQESKNAKLSEFLKTKNNGMNNM